MDFKVKTHKKINAALCGSISACTEDSCKILLKMSDDMVVDESGLIHGGFVFGLADYAAMVAVNDPNVVLGSADVKFMLPVKLGDELMAEASINTKEGTKAEVEVQIWRGPDEIFYGNFTCITPNKPVL